MFRFLHAADIHLDSPLKGLERYEGAPVEAIRHATRRALENLVRLAIEEAVNFVVIAGDLYDGDWRDHNTGLFFAKQMSELRQANIPVYCIAGNHDAMSAMTKHLKLPENVHEFSARKPETHRIEALGAALHGQSFPTQAVRENLTERYPAAVPGLFNIGLLHTSANGREGHEPYAPCTVSGLQRLGYQYWALGHVHTRETLSEDPPIHFPGNLQGRHIREAGAKGCLLVSVDDDLHASVAFQALDVLRWAVCRIDATAAEDADGVLDAFRAQLGQTLDESDGRPVALRVVVDSPTPAHHALSARPEQFEAGVRAIANDYGADQVWIEKVQIRTRGRDASRAAALAEGPLAELASLIEEILDNPAALEAAGQELKPLLDRLPLEVRQDPDALECASAEGLRNLIAGVQPLLIERLKAGGRAP